MLERVKSRENRSSLLRMSWMKPSRDSNARDNDGNGNGTGTGPEASNASSSSLSSNLTLSRTQSAGASLDAGGSFGRAGASLLVPGQDPHGQVINNGLERTISVTSAAPSEATSVPPSSSRPSSIIGRKSFSAIMKDFSTLSFGRSEDKERGRGRTEDKRRSNSVTSRPSQDDDDMDSIRARSTSPFRRRTWRARDPSPSVEALRADAESDTESVRSGKYRPRNAFSATSDDESPDEQDNDDDSSDEWSDEFDPITEQNTKENSMMTSDPVQDMMDPNEIPDPLGEGVNIVVPPEPYFPSTLNSYQGSRTNPRRRKSTRHHETLPISTSRPVFARDRCTITLTQGDPLMALESNHRRKRSYCVASDLSEESRFAVEWSVGTVIKDGDQLHIISVNENENKVDPPSGATIDKSAKLRNQQERQTLAYILVRQVIGLLQRTRLHVTVVCQAWHAKNSRHMLLDIVDYLEPTMLIVGSRGLGKLSGILLGSTSHYLVQKCSVPVMVARRRLKRPPRKSAHLVSHRARKSLAEAARVERVTPKVDKDVEDLREELNREEDKEAHMIVEDRDDDVDDDGPEGRKLEEEQDTEGTGFARKVKGN